MRMGKYSSATIAAVNNDTVKLDFNHPLAGKELTFDVTVTDLRAPTEEELAHGHVHYEDEGFDYEEDEELEDDDEFDDELEYEEIEEDEEFIEDEEEDDELQRYPRRVYRPHEITTRSNQPGG